VPALKPYLPAVILSLICLVTTGLLSLTYEMTREKRDYQIEAAANANRLALFPEAEQFIPLDLTGLDARPDDLLEADCVQDSTGTCLGYLFICSRRGYGGQVPVMVAVTPAGQIRGVRVLANDETPGLGKKVADASFLGQFTAQDIRLPFALKVDGKQQPVDAVSGATISSRAVTDAINSVGRLFLLLKLEVK
jgi:electron transport complex protein RnfG